MKDPLETKYAALKDPGIRAFMVAGERFYPANAASFTLTEQRDFYDLYCAHFRKPRPENIAVKDFTAGPVICRLYEPKPSRDLPVMLYLHGCGHVLRGLDPPYDDSENYADKLRDANIPVHVRHEPFLVHAFLRARHMSEPARNSFSAIVSAAHQLAHQGNLPD